MISEFHYLRRQNKALSNGHDALLKCLEKILKNTDLLTVRMDSLERKFDEIKPRQEEGRKRLKRIEKESSSGEYEQRLERSREKGKRSRRRTNGNGNSEVKVENRRKEEESN